MFQNYLKIAFRNFLKQKSYAWINIVGLTIGITCCFLIVLFVADELSFDRHFENADQIYRVAVSSKFGNQEMDEAVSSELLAGTLVQDYPEVLHSTRLQHTQNMLVRYKDKVFNETNFLWVDSTFFNVFPAKMLFGDPKTALEDHHTLVMTEATASKYFDNLADAIGEIVHFEDGTPYKITGIVKNLPKNSHFHYGMVCPLSSWEWNRPGSWLYTYMYTYIVLQKDFPPEQLEAKFPDFIQKHVAAPFQRNTQMTLDDFYKSGGKLDFHLQPVTSIHLHSHLSRELEPNSDIKYVYIFSIIALFILLIACVNFMNLSTARSLSRSREVGMRKVLGSVKSQLIKQFIFESTLYAFIAVVLALFLVEFFLPGFNRITGKHLALNWFSHWAIIPGFLAATLLVGVLAGSYPAFFLASFKPIEVLKKASARGTSGNSFMRSALVVFQFTISIILFVGTFIVYEQLQFVQNKRLGFDKENIVIIKRGWAIGQNPDGTDQAPVGNKSVFEVFKHELLQNPQIVSVAGVDNLPGKDYGDWIAKAEGASDEERLQFNFIQGDFNFAETMKFEFVEGRFFSPEIKSDTLGIVVNESAAKLLGFEKPYVGKRMGFIGAPDFFLHVIGVVKDFHYESLHHKIAPLVIGYRDNSRTYIAVRIQPYDVVSTVAFLEKTWNKFIPYKPFEYFFFDQDYDKLYQAEQRTGTLFTLFSVLAIIIACLGLLGLASFTTEQRTKEIGIRKVLGASVSNIILKLSNEFIKWVVIANLIAWPIGWYVSQKWLQNFAYRIGVGFWIFILAGGTALVIALLTLSWQATKAATANPVEALRYE